MTKILKNTPALLVSRLRDLLQELKRHPKRSLAQFAPDEVAEGPAFSSADSCNELPGRDTGQVQHEFDPRRQVPADSDSQLATHPSKGALMYFPPYQQLLRATHNQSADGQPPEKVTISYPLFKFLLQVALGSADFDEDEYLGANPEVRDHIARSGKITPHQHFLGYGYFEGRKGALPKVDEEWYLETYPDVAAAIPNKDIASATEHFELIGAAEGRAPSLDYLDVANQWKSLLIPRYK